MLVKDNKLLFKEEETLEIVDSINLTVKSSDGSTGVITVNNSGEISYAVKHNRVWTGWIPCFLLYYDTVSTCNDLDVFDLGKGESIAVRRMVCKILEKETKEYAENNVRLLI